MGYRAALFTLNSVKMISSISPISSINSISSISSILAPATNNLMAQNIIRHWSPALANYVRLLMSGNKPDTSTHRFCIYVLYSVQVLYYMYSTSTHTYKSILAVSQRRRFLRLSYIKLRPLFTIIKLYIFTSTSCPKHASCLTQHGRVAVMVLLEGLDISNPYAFKPFLANQTSLTELLTETIRS